MILKKFYGDSIKKARKKAFSELGKNCIVLESREASNRTEASVTVMLDGEKEEFLKDPEKREKNPASSTYSRKDLIPKSLNTVKKTISKGFDQFASGNNSTKHLKNNHLNSTPDSSDSVERGKNQKPVSRKNHNNTLQNRGMMQQEENSDFEQNLSEYLNGDLVSREVNALHRRFDRMEKLLSGALVSANIKYVSHPAFQQLLDTGIQAATVSVWFQKIEEKGIDPFEQNDRFMSELSKTVREALSFADASEPVKNLLFIGPPGSGKTSLIMKLATHNDFMANKRVALVSVEPDDEDKHYSSLAFFAEDYNLSCYTVGNGMEVNSLLPELEEFDHILFDSPPVSLNQQKAFKSFWKTRQILASFTPMEIHYTVNATLRHCYFTKEYAKKNIIQPDFVAITHMDQTEQWGHLVPFINGLGRSVRYASLGPQVPNGLRLFKNEWFAENILSTTS